MSTTQTAPLWTEMEAEDFGAATPGVLFDASALARKPDSFGTPDLFAPLDD